MLIAKIKRVLALRLIRFIQRARCAWYWMLSPNFAIGSPVLYQPMQAAGRGVIKFGANVRIGVCSSPSFLSGYAYIEARRKSAAVEIGEGTWINNGFCCIAQETKISIGRNCLIGSNVEIVDSDFHALRYQDRKSGIPGSASPVVLEDEVFIGSNVRILKGVRVGKGAVIANSSLVNSDIPPLSVAGGIPAKMVRVRS